MFFFVGVRRLTFYVDAEAERRDPATFDPSVNLRGTVRTFAVPISQLNNRIDYARIDLPTFTVSARDYIRLTSEFCNPILVNDVSTFCRASEG